MMQIYRTGEVEGRRRVRIRETRGREETVIDRMIFSGREEGGNMQGRWSVLESSGRVTETGGRGRKWEKARLTKDLTEAVPMTFQNSLGTS